MKKTITLKMAATFATAMAIIFSASTLLSSCKKEETPTNTTKTLDKSKLIGKKWYSQGGSFFHEFKQDGTYKIDGNWKWKNNSDTMEIVGSSGDPVVLWKFFWSSDKEMACNIVGDPGELLFKDAPW